MFKSYFKMAIRILKKNPSTSLISILGFSIAVACTTTAFLYADFLSNLDSFHKNQKNIYQIISHIEEEGEDVLYGSSPMLLANRLKADHADVIHATRLQYRQGNVRFGTQVFRERLLFVDNDFLRMFDFPIKRGNKSSLDKKQNIMLSEEIVAKYFDDKDPIGQRITIKFSSESIQSYFVSGVFSKSPENGTIKMDIVLPIDNYFDLSQSSAMSWTVYTNATFVLLNDKVQSNVLSGLMNAYKEEQNEANTDQVIKSFELYSLDGLANQSDRLYQPIANGNSISAAYMMAFIGLLILILACFNYLNIAVSSATKRLKEIAIRKVMGSARRNIIHQFLMENFIICGLSLMGGVILCYFLFLPGFNSIAPVDVPFTFSSPWRAILFYSGIWLIVGLLSGAYPALHISRYQPSVIFQGKQKFTRKNYFTRTLLTIQFFISFTAIVGSFIFTDNAFFVKSLGWGYDSDQLMNVKIEDAQHFDALRNIADNNSAVLSTAGSKGHIGLDNRMITFEYLNKKFRTVSYNVSPGYLKTMNVVLLKGRLFEDNKEAEESQRIVVNEDFVSNLDYDNPIGRQIVHEGKSRIIIGVIANIRHTFGSRDDTLPMIFTTSQNPVYNHLTIRFKSGQRAMVDEALEAGFHTLAPDDPYNRIYQSEIFNRFYDNVDSNIVLIMTISIMTVLLSCLGLYGLMSYNVQKNIKEIGIRTVMGAGEKDIIWLAVKEYAWVIIITLVLGVPIGSLLIQESIQALLTVTKPFSILPIILAMGGTLFTIAITIFGEIRKATRVNPVEALMTE